MSKVNTSLSISNPHPHGSHWSEKLGVAVGSVGLLILAAALIGTDFSSKGMVLGVALLSLTAAPILFAYGKYNNTSPGIKNNGVWNRSLSSRGLLAWGIGVLLTSFYVVLYWYPTLLGQGGGEVANSGIIGLFDPLSMALKGKPASQWFVYGTLYTVAIIGLGAKFMYKYRHNRYQLLRTSSVILFQLGFAFLIPEILQGLNPDLAYFDMDAKNMWPLDYDFAHSWHLKNLLNGGNLGMFFLTLGVAKFLLISPILTYFYGKRWYCSWVCGCGGLAETAGDSFRQLSDKSLKAWKIERWMIYSVLVLVTIMTIASLYGFFTNSGTFLGLDIYKYFQKPYGFFIGAAFSGVVGVGFYPLLGNRVWCRFGCPMAGLLGLQQKFFSRFRITTNGGQCISCGNCSTYCEMGIDVRAYAQKGQNIVRASCVGCGVCSAVCPRGVLKLENGKIDLDQRTSELKSLHIR